MKASAFRRNIWSLDGLVGILFGFWIGYVFQLEADSSSYLPDKILVASLIGGISYLLALFIGLMVRRRFQIISYLWISISGAMFFAFNKYVIWYLIENYRYSKSTSVSGYILQLLPQQTGSFLIVWVFTLILLLFLFLSIRSAIYAFEKLKPKMI